MRYANQPALLLNHFKLFFKREPPFKEKLEESFNLSFEEFKKYFKGIVEIH